MDMPSYPTNTPPTPGRAVRGGRAGRRRRAAAPHHGQAPAPHRAWSRCPERARLVRRDRARGAGRGGRDRGWTRRSGRRRPAPSGCTTCRSNSSPAGCCSTPRATSAWPAAVREALAAVGVDPDRVLEQEPDPALGNGGLGRLAACFMESMATLGIPAIGYGIRYEHGSVPTGLRGRGPEGAARRLARARQPLGVRATGPGIPGRLRRRGDRARRTREGRAHTVWEPAETLSAVAFDTPVIGGCRRAVGCTPPPCACGPPAPPRRSTSTTSTAATMSARSASACAWKRSRACSTPATNRPRGRNCGCGSNSSSSPPPCRTCCATTSAGCDDLRSLPDKAAIQLNDTHPAMAVAELMRLLVDVHGMEWDEAWRVTVATISYTNHTLLPEALETWPVALVERLLPRHLQIIYRLNAEHLERVRERSGGGGRRRAGGRVADRRAARAAGAHGATRLRRLARGQRRFGPAHRPAAPDRVRRPRRGLSGAHQQQDQRHHLPPLAAPRQPRPDAACWWTRWASACCATAKRSRTWPGRPTTAPSRPPSRRSGARARRRWPASSPSAPASRSTRTRCSTSTSSASTSTSASSSTSCRRSRCTTRSATSPDGTGCRGSRSWPARRRRATTWPSRSSASRTTWRARSTPTRRSAGG